MPRNSDYLAVCAIVRDEPDVREWVAYHRLLGVEVFYLYDNESVIPISESLSDFVREGWVRVIPIRGRQQQCKGAYDDCVRRLRGIVRWLAFIDADEFILPHCSNDLRQFLADCETFPAVGINWQIFGGNGIVSRDQRLVTEKFTLRAEWDFPANAHIKSIVDPGCVQRTQNPHCFRLIEGNRMVNGAFQPIPCDQKVQWAFNKPPTVERIQINHYLCKSTEDWRLKQARRGGTSGRPRTDDEHIFYEEHCNKIEDTRIQRFVPGMRRFLGFSARAEAT